MIKFFIISIIALALVFTYGLRRMTQLQTTSCPQLKCRGSSVFPLCMTKKKVSQIEDDGYFNQKSFFGLKTAFNKVLRRQPGQLILVRHGETAMNYNKTFTGWIDTDLSEDGVKEIEHAANLLLERGISVDITYTSRLKRAIRSAWILLIGLNEVYKPVYKSWRLNERMYGDLEGKSKVQIAEELGKELVQDMRRGLFARPPPMKRTHPYWHSNEAKYADLDTIEIPVTESLHDAMIRTLPLWQSRILPDLQSGRNVMVVAHANSLRGIVKLIDDVAEEDIPDVQIPNGIPLVYKFDRSMNSVKLEHAISPLTGEFVEKSGMLKRALEKEKKLALQIPGMVNGFGGNDGNDNVSSKTVAISGDYGGDIGGFSNIGVVNVDVTDMLFSRKDGVEEEDDSNDVDKMRLWETQKNAERDDAIPNKNMPVINQKTNFDTVLRGLTRLNQDRDFINHYSDSSEKEWKEDEDGQEVVLGEEIVVPQAPYGLDTSNNPPPLSAAQLSLEESRDSDEFVQEMLGGGSAAVAAAAGKLNAYQEGRVEDMEVTTCDSAPTQAEQQKQQSIRNPTAKTTTLTNQKSTSTKDLLAAAAASEADASLRQVLESMAAANSTAHGRDQLVVITRHGKTGYNKLGIFTGWEDAPLIDDGRSEARAAGRLLKKHGIQFDIVYTSWLSRAIETAWLILDEMDTLWLPIVKSWRLNERMYGALTGLSKSMIAERHGKEQFRKWRRGYDTRPPPTNSFSAVYPGNDDRYIKNNIDIRWSIRESFIRSFSNGRLELHRKLPKTESLKDCMMRTIPYFTDTIYPKSIAKGKSVLISSSENAIRGLLMHLCNIPTDRIHEVEIPTGLPLVYNIEKRCIQLLDDGTCPDDPIKLIERYNFGSSPELLFRPCNSSIDDSDECILYDVGDTLMSIHNPVIPLPATKMAEEEEEEDNGSEEGVVLNASAKDESNADSDIDSDAQTRDVISENALAAK